MTGIEGVAAAGAAKLAGAAAEDVKGSRAMKREVQKAEQLAVVEAAKETDGFKKAAEIRGKKLAVKEQWGLAIMRPLGKLMGVSREYFEADFGQDFAEVIADIPEEFLQTPKASIAGPVMEGLGYALDEPELKAMYLELLAHASDDREASSAHPSFVQVIRELSSEEAALLHMMLSRQENQPLVQLRAVFQPPAANQGWQTLATHIMNLTNEGVPVEIERFDSFVDNWTRLGLISVAYDVYSTVPGAYDFAENRPEYARAKELVADMWSPEMQGTMSPRGVTGVILEVKKGLAEATAFGEQFGKMAGIL